MGTLSQAQNNWINFTNNYSVSDIIESEQGAWLSSTGGLCFIDSMTQEETYYNRGNSNIPSNTLNDILLHPSNELWITTSNGICRMRNGTFELGSKKLNGVMHLTKDEKIVVFNNDSLYIQTDGMEFRKIAYPWYVAAFGGIEIDSEGAIYINAINWFAETYVAKYTNNQWEMLFSDYVYETSITLDHNDQLWFMDSEGLKYFEDNAWVKAFDIDSFDSFATPKLHVDKDNTILIELSEQCPRLLRWDRSNLTEISFTQDECKYSRFVKPSSSQSDTYFAYNLRNGVYQFTSQDIGPYKNYTQSPIYSNRVTATAHGSSEDHYIFSFNKIQKFKSNEWTEIALPETFTGGIQFGFIESDIIWICNLDQLWNYKNEVWNEISLPFNINGEIKTMEVGTNGDVWIQSDLKLALYKNQAWQVFETRHHGLTNSSIKDMRVDPKNGDLWVASFQGVVKYDGNTWTSFDFPVSNLIYDLAIAEKGVYALNYQGIFFIENNNTTLIPMPTIGEYNSFTSKMLFNDALDELYLTGTDHLAILKNEDWEVFTLENSNLYSGYSNNISLDPNGNLWLSGSNGGLSIFNAQGINLSTKEIQNKLPQNFIELYPTLLNGNEVFLKSKNTGVYTVEVYDLQGKYLNSSSVKLVENTVFTYTLPQSNSQGLLVIIKQEDKFLSQKLIRLNG